MHPPFFSYYFSGASGNLSTTIFLEQSQYTIRITYTILEAKEIFREERDWEIGKDGGAYPLATEIIGTPGTFRTLRFKSLSFVPLEERGVSSELVP
jgi:hypothetical protein